MKKRSGGKVSAPVVLLTARKTSGGNTPKAAVRLGAPRKNKKQRTPFRSGTVPYLFDENGTLWILLVTPAGGGRWIFPKGNLEKHMTSRESAVKEAYEEAGVRGRCADFLLGVQRFAEKQFVEFYPLQISGILENWEEAGRRSRLFFSVEDARKELKDPEAAAILDRLLEYLKEQENNG